MELQSWEGLLGFGRRIEGFDDLVDCIIELHGMVGIPRLRHGECMNYGWDLAWNFGSNWLVQVRVK